MNRFAVVFVAWGEPFVDEVATCIRRSAPYLADCDRVLVTDLDTPVAAVEGLVTHVIRAVFRHEGLLRKTELLGFLPDGYRGYLLLDSDTVVLGDLSLGFEKAMTHGIAASPAPHYSLDAFWGFSAIMEQEDTERRGQLQYNTGVIFFRPSPEVNAVFRRWGELGERYAEQFRNDQPFFTLALEQLGFNPYTLSISYNYRGFGDAISGDVRIWHSHGELPPGINDYTSSWPPRRAWPGEVVHPPAEPRERGSRLQRLRARLRRKR